MQNFIDWVVGHLNFTTMRIPSISISSIIEMILMAFIIYKVLVWIAQSRAWTLFKGILFLAVVYLLAGIFKFHIILWIVSNTFSVGLIALVIIFQPEVRKVLEQIGTGTLNTTLKNFAGSEEDPEETKTNAMDEIIAACQAMSKAHTGALIVLENEVPLGDIKATGVMLDAILTNQLIISIFEDKMPLHDGAVVVSKNRIAAAGCILPLTEKEIGGDLGTRHRAAVGLSEVSDAYVVIVSNETSAISIAYGGRLYRNLSEDEIRNMLYGTKKPPKRKLASFFRGR